MVGPRPRVLLTLPLVPSLGAETALLSFFTAHTFPCINSVWSNRLHFGFLNPENGTVRLYRNVGKKLTATGCLITQKSAVLEPEVSLLHSQASATCSYPEPDHSSPVLEDSF